MASGATPVAAPEEGFTTSVDALIAAVSERTRIVFVANPNNPTGTYLPESEVLEFASLCEDGVERLDRNLGPLLHQLICLAPLIESIKLPETGAQRRENEPQHQQVRQHPRRAQRKAIRAGLGGRAHSVQASAASTNPCAVPARYGHHERSLIQH